MDTTLKYIDLLNIRDSLERNIESLNDLDKNNNKLYYFKIEKMNTYLKIFKMIKEY